jgi:hypothetical protein
VTEVQPKVCEGLYPLRPKLLAMSDFSWRRSVLCQRTRQQLGSSNADRSQRCGSATKPKRSKRIVL